MDSGTTSSSTASLAQGPRAAESVRHDDEERVTGHHGAVSKQPQSEERERPSADRTEPSLDGGAIA